MEERSGNIIIDNQELEHILPDLRKELNVFNSDNFKNYEDLLTKATSKAIKELERITEDGILALDPEQLVAAVKVLTKARMDVMDSKRKLFETVVKGEVMMKALEPPKDNKNDSSNAMLEYMKAMNLSPEAIKKSTQNSIFGNLLNEYEQEDKEED
jgi:hypothetical protein